MSLGPSWFRAPLLTWLLVSGAPLVSQEPELSERLYRSGERAYAARSYDEAFETWNQLLKQAPTSSQAAQALYQMARHHAEVAQAPDLALPLLDRLRTEHMASPVAADGILLRGRILARRARKPADLKEAMAEFNRVVDLFPTHGTIPQAHLALGQAHLAQGALGRALEQLTEVQRWDRNTPEAAQAMLLTAEVLDLAGDLNGCLRQLQSVRNRFPDLPEAKEAEWRLNVRVKHRLLRPPLKSEGLWPEGRTKWLKTPTLMATGPDGVLFIYQQDLDQAFRLEAGQLVATGPQVKDAKALFVTPAGKVGLVSSKLGIVREDASAPTLLGNLGNPSGACLDLWGNVWVADAKAGSLGLFLPDGTSRSLPSPSLTALAPLPGGAMLAASDANRTLQVLDASGQPKASWPYGKDLPAGFKYVVALATDPTGHAAALVDGDFEGIVVWGPNGQVLRQATYKQLGISGRFRALAFDRLGGILLADRSNDVLVRLQ